MTFEDLIREVTKRSGLKNHKGEPAVGKVESIIRDALLLSVTAAKNGGRAPVFPGIGRFVMTSVRSTGRKPDGTQWTTPGRRKLALRASVHAGGRGGVVKPSAAKPKTESVAA